MLCYVMLWERFRTLICYVMFCYGKGFVLLSSRILTLTLLSFVIVVVLKKVYNLTVKRMKVTEGKSFKGRRGDWKEKVKWAQL